MPDGKGGCCTSHSCDAVVWDDLPATLKRKLDQQKEAIRKEVLAAAAKVPVENARL